jgi:catechol 2,3-dioxygenase-like lactoylglutathione lyase family enzyme
MRFGRFLLAALAAGAPLLAELIPPNDAGVTVGHIHLTVKDVEAQTRFWVDMIGGTVVKGAPVTEIEFPGVYLVLRQGDATGPSAGSVVDHFGFVVKDLPAGLAKWRAAGLTVTQSAYNPNQGSVTGPEGIRLEVFGVPTLKVPVQMNHIHFMVLAPEIPAIQAWYAKAFGLTPGKRESVARPGNIVITDELPGDMNLSLAAAKTATAPTQGRSIDHIGFEVKNLEGFCKKLEANGIKLDGPVRRSGAANSLKVALLTDPWGTRIELTEGIEAVGK